MKIRYSTKRLIFAKKKFDLYPFKKNLKIFSNKKFTLRTKSDLQIEFNKFSFKRILLSSIEAFVQRGYNFSNICEMCITTVSPNENMTYEISN